MSGTNDKCHKYSNKDHMYDEVDSMLISVNVPKKLTEMFLMDV